jgi:hypothetical protein
MPPAADAMKTGLPCAVQHDPQIQFTLDRQRLLDEQSLHDAALGSRLVRDEVHAEDVRREVPRFVRVFRDLDASALAATSGVNLGLNDHASADFAGAFSRFLRRVRDLSSRHRYAVPAQDGLRLILVNFHLGSAWLAEKLAMLGWLEPHGQTPSLA